MKKRLVAFLLVLIMVLGMLPTTALASFDAQEATLVDETEAALVDTYAARKDDFKRTFRIKVQYGDSFPNVDKNDTNFPYTCTVQTNAPSAWLTLSTDPGTYVSEYSRKKVIKYYVANAGYSNAFVSYQPGAKVDYLSAQPYMVICLEGGQASEKQQTFQYQVVYLRDNGRFSTDMEDPVSVDYVCQNNAPRHNESTKNDHKIKNDDIWKAAKSVKPREGYTLIGWSWNNNGSTSSYEKFKTGGEQTFSKNQSIYFLAKKTAQPETKYTYILKYDAGEGTGGPDSDSWSTTDKLTGSHTFDIKTGEPTREGFVFKGWKASNAATIYRSDGLNGASTTCLVSQYQADVVKSGNTWTKTLYAVWESSGPDAGPGEDVFKSLYVQVLCETDNGHNSNVPYANGQYTVAWKQGAAQATVTFEIASYVKYFNTLSRDSNGGKTHTAIAGQTVTKTFRYVDGKWEQENTDRPTIRVTCITTPGKPTAGKLTTGSLVEVDCQTNSGHSALRLPYIAGTFVSATDVLQNEGGKYYSEVTLQIQPYVDAYNSDTAADGVSHTKVSNGDTVTVTLYYDEVTKTWGPEIINAATGAGEYAKIHVTCNSEIIPVPARDNITGLQLFVQCTTNTAAHAKRPYPLTGSTYKSGNVNKNPDTGVVTSSITVNSALYVALYNQDYSGVTHTVTDATKTLTIPLTWNGSKWAVSQTGLIDDYNVFKVTCESTGPNAPTAEKLDGMTIARVRCMTSNTNHADTPYAYIENTLLDTDEVENHEGTYTCTVWLEVAPYVAKYNEDNAPQVHSRQAADAARVPVTMVYDETNGWTVEQIGDHPAYADIKVYCDLIPMPEHDAFADDVILINCDTDSAHDAELAYKNGEYEIFWTRGSSKCTVSFTVSEYVDYYTNNGHANHTAVTETEYIEKGYTYVNNKWKPDDTPRPVIHVKCTEQPIYVYFRPINSNVNPDSNSLTLADETLDRLNLTYNNDNKDWFTYGKLMSASTDMNKVKAALSTPAFTRHDDNKDFAYGDLISWAGELGWVNMGYHLGYDGETADAYHLNGDLKFYWVKYDTNAGADSGKVTGAPTNYYDGGIQDYYLVGETISKMPTLSRPGYKFLGWTVTVEGNPSAQSLPETDGETTGTVDVEGGKPYEFTQYGNITFVAQWEAEKYDIIYHSNYNVEGMTEETRSSTAKTDEKVALKNISSTGFEKPGYTFAGWNTKADGTGTLFVKTGNANKVVFTAADIEDGKVHLYAQWTANGYTVKFDKNGGEGSMENQSFTYDVEQALTANAFTKTGYTFLGWNTKADGTGTGYEDGELVKNLTSDPDGVVTLYAQWKENSYTVKFDKNGDNVQGKMNSQKFTYDAEAKALTKNKYTRTGYTFTGWNTKADGTGTSYADEALVRNLTAEANGVVTLYAQWEANRYTVKFDKNSSNAAGTMTDQSFTYDEAAKTLNKNTFSRVGYTFAGWNTQADGKGTSYADEALVRNLTAEANGVVTLYAQWNINLYPFVFDSQGGSAVPTQTVAHGSTAPEPTDPTRSGYWFVGWYTDTTFTKLYDFSTPVTGPTTVYARWSMIIIPGTITKKNPKLNTYDHFAYVQGYPDGTVKPEGNITRAETAAILFRLMDNSSRKTYLSTKSGFRDVTAGSWYNTYVATLNNAGVITDSANGYFRPNEAITRAELAAMLASFTETTRAANYFDDVSANHWAAKAIAICAKLGWITGYPDGSFRPDRNVTRAELMAMINRATGRAPKSADAFLPGMKTWSDNTADKWYYLDVQEATNSHSYAVSPTELWTALTAAPDWSRYE